MTIARTLKPFFLSTLPFIFIFSCIFSLAGAVMHDVDVGPGASLAFEPKSVDASPGDVINFIFNNGNHSVTESTWDDPCIAVSGGFDTGFITVPQRAPGGFPVYQYTVKGIKARMFFCRQAGHCARGMTFILNVHDNTSELERTSPTDSFITPSLPHWGWATATISQQSSTWTTTYSSYDGSAPPQPSPRPVDYKILVAEQSTLAFSPSNITVAVGDTVTFEFRTGTHGVTRSSFMNPCRPLEDADDNGKSLADGGRQGFNSGLKTQSGEDFPQFQIKINDTTPIYGYCPAHNHCGLGMVFSINAVASGPNNFTSFQKMARHLNGTIPQKHKDDDGEVRIPNNEGGAKDVDSNSNLTLSVSSWILICFVLGFTVLIFT